MRTIAIFFCRATSPSALWPSGALVECLSIDWPRTLVVA